MAILLMSTVVWLVWWPLEDLLEEIVGEIDDETDKAEQFVREIAEDTYIVLGTMTPMSSMITLKPIWKRWCGHHCGLLSDRCRYPFRPKMKKKPMKWTVAITLVMMNDKVKNGCVTKLKVLVTKLEIEEEKD